MNGIYVIAKKVPCHRSHIFLQLEYSVMLHPPERAECRNQVLKKQTAALKYNNKQENNEKNSLIVSSQLIPVISIYKQIKLLINLYHRNLSK